MDIDAPSLRLTGPRLPGDGALEVRHRLLDVVDGRIHAVEQGTGPLVVLIHGFPESWWSWRAQIPAIAAAGFRAAAIDVRGYGRSSKPANVSAYRLTALVRDVVGVVHALGEETAVVVGHDVGSPIAAATALLRPEVVRGVGLLSVPYTPRGAVRPSDAFAGIGGDEEFYVSYFQAPGRAEAEIEPHVRDWLAGFFTGLAGETAGSCGGNFFIVPLGGRMRDRFPRGPRPAWLTDADLDVYAAEFERTGMTGALNRYRNLDRDWEDLADHEGAPITQPSLFIGGELDSTTTWMADAIEAHATTVPGLMSSHVLPGCGHWLQQERPAEVSTLLTDWLRSLPART